MTTRRTNSKKYIEITREEHTALMEGQAHGKVITFHEDKKPTLEDPPPPTEAEIAERKISELEAVVQNSRESNYTE